MTERKKERKNDQKRRQNDRKKEKERERKKPLVYSVESMQISSALKLQMKYCYHLELHSFRANFVGRNGIELLGRLSLKSLETKIFRHE